MPQLKDPLDEDSPNRRSAVPPVIKLWTIECKLLVCVVSNNFDRMVHEIFAQEPTDHHALSKLSSIPDLLLFVFKIFDVARGLDADTALISTELEIHITVCRVLFCIPCELLKCLDAISISCILGGAHAVRPCCQWSRDHQSYAR